MKFSDFGVRFCRKSGILQLMDDLGDALNSEFPVNMLGGGNPARIAEVDEVFGEVLNRAVADGSALESVGNYANPQGDARFIAALADFFRSEYGWDIDSRNIALTNGSQNAFFCLFNLFGGRSGDQNRAVLLPLVPEYVGYADAHIGGGRFLSVPPKIEMAEYEGATGFFKYAVDFDALENLDEWAQDGIGAICCSRPTNPTGNVLTDVEVERLDALAQRYGVPLIIDNAYGMPFPNIIHSPATLQWHENIILCFSLSKVGLPGTRTGIVIAAPEVVEAVAAMNAVSSLAPTRFGAALATPLLADGRLKRLSQEAIRPFYRRQVRLAVDLLKRELSACPFRIHCPEGAIFLWLWFPGLPVSSEELYRRLKAAGTLILPGEPFFIGLDTQDYAHARECIRMSIAADEAVLRRGIADIGRLVRQLFGA